MKDNDQISENTDHELWREREGDYYADSIHVTKQGGIGINCGGFVIVMPLQKWHELARAAHASKQWTVEEKDTQNTLSGIETKRMPPLQPMRRMMFFCTACDMETEHYAAEGYWNCHACGASVTNSQ